MESTGNTMNGHHDGVAVDETKTVDETETVDETKTVDETETVDETKTVDGSVERTADPEPPAAAQPAPDEPTVELLVRHNKGPTVDDYRVCAKLSSTVLMLKQELADTTGIPVGRQKIVGLPNDNATLQSYGFRSITQITVVDTQFVSVATPSREECELTLEPLCRRTPHMRVLRQGIPYNIMVGILNTQDPLPPHPLIGILNRHGKEVKLIFKLEINELWICQNRRRQIVNMNRITRVRNEPIEGYFEYHIVCLHRLDGNHESRYWLYWVPAQFIDSMKEAILGR